MKYEFYITAPRDRLTCCKICKANEVEKTLELLRKEHPDRTIIFGIDIRVRYADEE